MTKKNLFINILFVIIAIIFSAISQCSSALSDKRLCYNPDCSEPVSLARTTIRYVPNEPGLLKFDVSVKVTVYSKEAGNRTDLWGVEINGKHGYVPKRFLKEYKVIHKNLQYEVPINQLFNNNVVSTEKLHLKENNDKSKFDTKDIEASNIKSNNLDLKSTEELPHNVTPAYEIIDGTTVHLNQNEPFLQPTFATGVVEATIVPNKQNAVDDLELKSNNEKNESDIFTKDAKLQQKVLKEELKVEEESSSTDLNTKDFVTNLAETLNLPDSVTIPNISSLDATENLETKVENEVKNVQNSLPPTTKDASPLESNTNINISPTLVSDDIKQELQGEAETAIEVGENDNVDLDQTVAINVHVQNTENIHIFEEKGDQLSDNVTVLKTEQKELKVESKSTKHLSNASALLDETYIMTEGTSLTENDKGFVANTTESDKVDDKFLEIDKDTKQSQLKAETHKTEDLSEYSSDLYDASLVLESNVKSATKLSLSSDISKDEESKEKTKPNETSNIIENTTAEITSEEETILSISQNSNFNFKEDNNATIITNEVNDQELDKKQNLSYATHDDMNKINEMINETIIKAGDNLKDVLNTNNYSVEMPNLLNKIPETKSNIELPEQLPYPAEKDVISENVMNANEFRNRNLLNIETNKQFKIENEANDETDNMKDKTLVEDKSNKVEHSELHDNLNTIDIAPVTEPISENKHEGQEIFTPDICTADNIACSAEDNIQNDYTHEEMFEINENVMDGVKIENSYLLTLIYLSVTATAVLTFSLGYYYIENMRRDRQLIAKVNKLEKDLLVANKECATFIEELTTMKKELRYFKDESFDSKEMVLSLKVDLEASQNARTELEDQVVILEKDLESATEAGLELERMLREVLSSNNEVNPLAQSVEDLQARLNAQQAANESLTNTLNLKTQENESLSTKFGSLKKKYEEVKVELSRVTENLKLEKESKNSLEQTLTDKVHRLEMQIKEISTEKATLQKKLKGKEVETKDLLEVINRLNSNNLDLDKLYEVSNIKAEATALLEERNDLRIRLVEVEGAHHLLEEHMRVVKEEIATLSEQCKIAEKEKKDAETRLDVLSNFFEEKEAQRQKEEAIWLQQQGEVVSTVERIQTMQTEIQNYKQQIEMLKREILDQEREYKNQISVLETKAHEQWVIARQVERRLEESRVEAGQLRNRLTLIEKNINDADSEAKLHRLEANGETTTSPPLFMGESSSSPIMFSNSSSVPPPPPPSYLHSLFPPYLPPPLPNTSGVPPYEVSQRPAPLGGRLSSPPPMPLHPSASNRYDNTGSPPPPMSPHVLPPFNHRSPPPPPFGSDIHPPLLPPPDSILPLPRGTPRSWGDESLPPPRNSGFHPPRERIRNHKGSLHSSGESLDKTHHNSKV